MVMHDLVDNMLGYDLLLKPSVSDRVIGSIGSGDGCLRNSGGLIDG